MSKHRNNLNDQTGFVLAVLAGGTVYAHKVVIAKTIHFLIVIVLSLAALLIYLVLRRIRRPSSLRNHGGYSLEDIDRMTGLEFEHFVADLLKKNGYTNVRLTEKYDYGIDIIAVKDEVTWGIQAKRYSGPVKASAIRQVVTGLRIYNCDRAMVITNSTYSKVAIKLAISNDCLLIDGSKLFAS